MDDTLNLLHLARTGNISIFETVCSERKFRAYFSVDKYSTGGYIHFNPGGHKKMTLSEQYLDMNAGLFSNIRLKAVSGFQNFYHLKNISIRKHRFIKQHDCDTVFMIFP